MKSKFKKLLLMVGLFTFIFLNPIVASAQTNEQDNLKIKFKLEQVQGSTDEIKGTIKITNIGIRAIDNVNLDNIIPDEVKAKDGQVLSKEIGTIQPGESITHKFNGIIDTNVIPGGDGDADDGNEEGADQGKEDSTTSNNVSTGDNNLLLGLMILMGGCGAILAAISRKKVKEIKKTLSVFLCITLGVTLLQGSIVSKANEVQRKEMNVSQNITVDDKVHEFKVVITYDKKINESFTSGRVISRGEWISDLVQKTKLKDEQPLDIDKFESKLTDISGNQYEVDILYAEAYGVLPIGETTFRPDEPSTREFTAVTTVNILGFNPIKDIVCDDADEITFKKNVETAVFMQLINLEGNKFYPNRGLTEGEENYVLEGVEGVIKSTEIDENYESVLEYKDNVIVFDEKITSEINNSIVTFEVNSETKALKSGDIFVLGVKPYKVKKVKVEKSKVIVETEEPKIEETMHYLDAQGYGTVDMNGFIPAEGVTVIEEEQPQTRINLDGEGSVSLRPVKVVINKKFNNKYKLEGELEFGLPKVSYKADVDLGFFDIDVNNAFLKFTTDSKAKATFSKFAENDITNPKELGLLELGKVPIVGIPGVTIYAQVALRYNFEGKISVEYKVEGDFGAQILNNRLRAIKSLTSGFQVPSAEASLKVGPKLSGLLEICETWPLIDFSIDTGAAGEGAAKIQPNGMLCVDLAAYWYLELSALELSVINNWFELSCVLPIFDGNNSPLKIKKHYENLSEVEACTYCTSGIEGKVVSAGNNSAIEGARIQILNAQDNTEVQTTYSNASGKYTTRVKPGNYIVKISKVGYIPFESNETVEANEVNFVNTYLVVENGAPGEKGIAGGKITNALNGENISGVTLNVRNGWSNMSSGIVKTITTDENGMYNVELPLGNYTIEMVKGGFITSCFNIVVIPGSSLNQNNTMVPTDTEMPAGDLRIVLTWAETPRDLDSHLVGPKADGNGTFHTWYAGKSYYYNGEKYADLDLDDTNSYGPETTTVYNMNNSGIYSFYVHDFTNRYSSSSIAMSNSGALVKVYKGELLVASYPIPTDRQGIYWKVFDYDAATNKIIPVNEIVNTMTYNNRARGLSEINFEMKEK